VVSADETLALQVSPAMKEGYRPGGARGRCYRTASEDDVSWRRVLVRAAVSSRREFSRKRELPAPDGQHRPARDRGPGPERAADARGQRRLPAALPFRRARLAAASYGPCLVASRELEPKDLSRLTMSDAFALPTNLIMPHPPMPNCVICTRPRTRRSLLHARRTSVYLAPSAWRGSACRCRPFLPVCTALSVVDLKGGRSAVRPCL
jgi:hypothetical protein